MFKKLSNKKRRIIGFSVMGATVAFGLTTTLMIAPGMGMESLMFIKSVERELKQITPKGKFVLDSTSPTYPLVKNVIKKSFIADAVSTIDFRDPSQLALKGVYEEYAAYWFEDHFGENVDIDLYDIGNSLIEFDKSVAGKFHSTGFVNTGPAWIFTQGGLSEIYGSDVYNLGLNQQTILDQNLYTAYIHDNGSLGNINGVEVEYSIGAHIVNNKVWFLNKQIESIRSALTLHVIGGAMGINVFKDDNNQLSLNDDIFNKYVIVDDLYHPNFTATLQLLRVAIVLFALNFAVIPAGVTVTVLTLKGTKKPKNTEEVENEEIN
ncbi:hypothetical protein STIUS_v1c06880 [Spiroplasma sp. TIUS-1]|uniref:hypothetical protein n=1 Tax=Spiroplasma sp. TIUS-1 TaxID=216963 RepID=UPI0013984E06|nr:hypothetical protein [Spiroplasma sp. TIUS-1]QHX36242.1 hypothetical protein STIUS_v1c06880 [Spiroplasma sp. TIUS-1]